MIDIIDLMHDNIGRWSLRTPHDRLQAYFDQVMEHLNCKYHDYPGISEYSETEQQAVDRHFFEAMGDYFSSH